VQDSVKVYRKEVNVLLLRNSGRFNSTTYTATNFFLQKPDNLIRVINYYVLNGILLSLITIDFNTTIG
jgi:hypothetical protein